MTIDWNDTAPGPEAWDALQEANEEDFPKTYNGTAWCAAWRLLKVAKEEPERFSSWDGWTSDKLAHEAVEGIDLTGFMFGWAINALRSMMEMPPVADGATVTIGSEDKNIRSLPGSAKQALDKTLGT